MKQRSIVVGVLALGFLGLIAFSAVGKSSEGSVAYPTDYRSWTHVKSMVIQKGHPLEQPFLGIHHIYANAQALEGLQTGKYPDGAVLAFDLLAAVQGDKTLTEGDRSLLGVMQKNAASYSETGGWGFEAFAGDGQSKRLVSDGGVSCYLCHTSVSEQGFVFSRLRD